MKPNNKMEVVTTETIFNQENGAGMSRCFRGRRKNKGREETCGWRQQNCVMNQTLKVKNWELKGFQVVV